MFLSSNEFVKVTSKLRRTKKYVDAKVILEDGSIHDVHKYLLARDSIFFRKLFTHFHEKDGEYGLTMVAEMEFVRVLDWIYEVRYFFLIITASQYPL